MRVAAEPIREGEIAMYAAAGASEQKSTESDYDQVIRAPRGFLRCSPV